MPTSNPTTLGDKHICTHCFATSGKTFTHPEPQCRNKQKKNQIISGMSLGTHTRSFGTQVILARNVHLAPQIVEFETNKQTAFQWYRMQRSLQENSPHLSYAEVLKKQSTSLGKQSVQTLPRKTRTHNVKVSPDHFQAEVHNSPPANTQFGGNKRLVLFENKKKHTGKVECNAHSHIAT